MDGESTEATSIVESSSQIQIIGRTTRNPENMMSTHGLFQDLGSDQLRKCQIYD